MKLTLCQRNLFDGNTPLSDTLSGSKQRNVRQRLKKLAEQLANYRLVSMQWANFSYFEGLLLVFSHGTISSVCFDSQGAIVNVYHEHYLHQHLASNRVCSIEICENFIIISYIEPLLSYVSLENNIKRTQQTPTATANSNDESTNKKLKRHKFKVSNSSICKTLNLDHYHDPHLLTKRHLELSTEHAMMWWNTSLINSWSCKLPNVLLFTLNNLSVIASNSFNGEILKSSFVEHKPNHYGILARENTTSFTLTYSVHKISTTTTSGGGGSVENKDPISLSSSSSNCQLSMIFQATIPLDKACLYAEFTRLQDKILLLCDDESVMLFNIEQNVLYALHSSMAVCYLASNPADAIMITSNQYGHLSLYDYAFNNISIDIVPYESSMMNGGQNTTGSGGSGGSGSGSVSAQQPCTNVITKKPETLGLCDHWMSIKQLQFLTPQLLLMVMVDNKREDSSSSSTHKRRTFATSSNTNTTSSGGGGGSILTTSGTTINPTTATMTSNSSSSNSNNSSNNANPNTPSTSSSSHRHQNHNHNHRHRSSCQLILLSLPVHVDYKQLVHEYLHERQFEQAVNILRVINWNCVYEQAYYCLNVIFQHFLKQPLCGVMEQQIESTLATFLIPCTPIDHKIFEQMLPFIRHLAVRFFYHLIQHRSYAKAYKLGVELKSRRHFLLLYKLTKQHGQYELMNACYRQMQLLA